MAKKRVHVVCNRYFASNSCTPCPLNVLCDRQGFVPAGFTSPPTDPTQFAQWLVTISATPTPALNLGQPGEQSATV